MRTMRVGSRSVAFLLVVAAGLGVSSGCGGETGSGSGSRPVSRSELPGAVAEAVCGNIGPCCQQSGLPFNAANCRTALTELYRSAIPEADAGTYNAQASGPCLDAIGSAAAKCDFSTADTPGSESCADLFGGTTPHGKASDPCYETCTQDGTTASCFATVSSGPGPIDAGRPLPCYTNDGVYCDFANGVCRNRVGLGAPCTESEACNNGWCDVQVCAALLGEGGDCRSSSQSCATGLYCDFAAGTCMRPKPEGAPCQSSIECEKHRCQNQVCDASSSPSLLKFACVG